MKFNWFRGIDPDLSECPKELSPKCQRKKKVAEKKKKKRSKGLKEGRAKEAKISTSKS